MNPRRILVFSLSYFPHLVGGAEVAVKEITDRISGTDAQFDMITLGDGKSPSQELIGNVHVYRLSGGYNMFYKLMYPWRAAHKARKLMKTNRYVAMWAIMASYAGFAAYLVKRTHRLPIILNIQEGDNFARRRGIFRPGYFKIFRAADRIHAISTFLGDWSRQQGARCPIDIVPNAVDVKTFSANVPAGRTDPLIKLYGKKENDVFLVTTSRLVTKNAVDDIIEALALLPKHVKLLILGSGPLETELKQQVLRLGLNYTDEPPVNPGNRVHFAGYVSHAEMVPYLAVSDVFVRPPLSEGLGISFLEAMAARLPIIATRVGGIPEFLKEGETGLFCEVRNPRSIATAVEKYLNDKELRGKIVKKASAMVRDTYEWNIIAEKMKTIFASFA